MTAARSAAAVATFCAGIALGLAAFTTPRLAVVPLAAAAIALAVGLDRLRVHSATQEPR